MRRGVMVGHIDHCDNVVLVNKSTCRNAAEHTPCPEGYLQWHDWAHRMSKTHRQIRCLECGLFSIWLPKAEAKRVERERFEEAKANSDKLVADFIARRQSTPPAAARAPDPQHQDAGG